MSWNVWNRPQEVVWSIWGSHQTLWSLPLPNVTWHSWTWQYTTTPSIDQTLHQFASLLSNWTLLPILTFGGFHNTLQRMRLANRGRLLLRTPAPLLFGTCINILFSCWDHSFLNLSCLRTFWVLNIHRYFYFVPWTINTNILCQHSTKKKRRVEAYVFFVVLGCLMTKIDFFMAISGENRSHICQYHPSYVVYIIDIHYNIQNRFVKLQVFCRIAK